MRVGAVPALFFLFLVRPKTLDSCACPEHSRRCAGIVNVH